MSNEPHPLELVEQYLGTTSAKREQSGSNTKYNDEGQALVSGTDRVNKQLLEAPGIDARDSDPLKLFGAKNPNLAVQSEKPEHRIMIYLKAQGLSNNEIAEKLNYSRSWVSQITRQPFFQLAVVAEIHRQGKDAVAEFLKGETMNSVMTLVEIRDSGAAKEATRVAAANAILDRALGKPTQHIKSEVTRRDAEAFDEMTKLNLELESIRLQQRSAGILPNQN